MKLTIVKPDNIVGINKEFYTIDLTTNPILNGIRVVQWDETSGHIEYDDVSNESLNVESVKQFDSIVELWTNAKNKTIEAQTKKINDTAPLDEILSVYPIVNIKDAISVIQALTNESMILKLMTRSSYSSTCPPELSNDIIGVSCEQLRYTDETIGAVTLLNMRSFRELSFEYGIPIFSFVQDPITAEQIAQYNVTVMGQSRINIGDLPFLYSPWDLPIYKKRKDRIIDADRDATLDNGFTWNGYMFDSDEASRNNLTSVVASVNAGIPLPPDFVWRTKDNQSLPLTSTQLVELGGAMLDFVNSTYVTSWDRKTVVQNATTFQQVDNA